ncbi:hypothetical protein [Mucilaginibacter sp. OK098]|uniref:hypothetical protein n=1 Tax=Mucilaginibacter sp. OK098 TaxID=1855297 RepID=UPI0009218B3E|nr:hypothetical protein [Mucilaginibacter sp. OK098]SHN33053.1 hypothetical protein SAMN05216524_11043 [Mucilaginibacter sp. OK098]
MKKAAFLTLTFNFFICFYAIGQNRTIPGLVTFNAMRQSGVVIKNVNLHTQIISNDRGEFTIQAKAGDTLISSKEDYIKDTLLVTDQPFFIIQLKKNPLILKEVLIKSSPITIEETYAKNKKDYKEIYRIGDKSNIIGPDNIDKIWSAVCKEGNDARKLQRTLTSDYKSSLVNRRFTKTLVTRITGYKDTTLDNFMIKYRPTFKMVQKATDYDLIQYIKKKMAEDKKI